MWLVIEGKAFSKVIKIDIGCKVEGSNKEDWKEQCHLECPVSNYLLARARLECGDCCHTRTRKCSSWCCKDSAQPNRTIGGDF